MTKETKVRQYCREYTKCGPTEVPQTKLSADEANVAMHLLGLGRLSRISPERANSLMNQWRKEARNG